MNRAAQLYGMDPDEVLKLNTVDFHRLMAWTVAAERDNLADLKRIIRRAKDGDMGAGIAAAAAAGGKAAR